MNKAQTIMRAIDDAFDFGAINKDLAALILFVTIAVCGYFYVAGLMRRAYLGDDPKSRNDA